MRHEINVRWIFFLCILSHFSNTFPGKSLENFVSFPQQVTKDMSYFLAKQCQSNLSKFPGNRSMKFDADEKWKTATIQKRFYAGAFSHEIMTEKGNSKLALERTNQQYMFTKDIIYWCITSGSKLKKPYWKPPVDIVIDIWSFMPFLLSNKLHFFLLTVFWKHLLLKQQSIHLSGTYFGLLKTDWCVPVTY